MRKSLIIAATMLAIFVLASPSVMAASYFEWLRDDDGDGIPNCLDEDYVKPLDGTGYGKLGPTSLSSVLIGAQSGDQDQIKDREQLKDGSCLLGTSAGNMYRYKHSYKYNWGGFAK